MGGLLVVVSATAGNGFGFSPGPFHRIAPVSLYPSAAVIMAFAIMAAAFFAADGLLGKIAPNSDKVLLTAVFALTCLGFLLSLRLFPQVAALESRPPLHGFYWRHWYYILIGLAAMTVAAAMASQAVIQRLARRKYIYAVCAAGLIIATGLIGEEINDRRLWLSIGPFRFQTIEFVKILAVLFAAGYLAERRGFMARPVLPDRLDRSLIHRLGPFAFAAALCILPVVFQKDFGPAFMLVLLMLCMYYAGAGSRLIVMGCLAALVMVAWLCYRFELVSMVNTRFDMWMDPFHRSEALSRALWAAASGGLLGTGLGQGMGVSIPTVWSDFTFVIICEELGWVGGVSVIGLYGLVVYRGLAIAASQPDVYRALLAVGLSSSIAIQVLLIVCGNLVLLPLTGITLPLVSYGGSSLVITFLMIGMLLGLSSGRLAARPAGGAVI